MASQDVILFDTPNWVFKLINKLKLNDEAVLDTQYVQAAYEAARRHCEDANMVIDFELLGKGMVKVIAISK